MLVSEILAKLNAGSEFVSVDAPEVGEGVKVHFRTRLSVADVLSLPDNFPRMADFAQNVLLFWLLVRDSNKTVPNLDDGLKASADAMALSAIVERAGLRETVFRQLAAGEDAKPTKGKSGP